MSTQLETGVTALQQDSSTHAVRHQGLYPLYEAPLLHEAASKQNFSFGFQMEGEVFHVHQNNEMRVPRGHIYAVFEAINKPDPLRNNTTPNVWHLRGQIDLLRGAALQRTSQDRVSQ